MRMGVTSHRRPDGTLLVSRAAVESARASPTAEEVADHDIPLQGKRVSGLHVANNLQILTGSENSRKRNHFEVDG